MSACKSGTLVTIQPDGTETRVHCNLERGENTLRLLQTAVGGYIERIPVKFDGRVRDGWVNEEGLLRDLPPNRTANTLADASKRFRGVRPNLVGPLAIWIPDPKGNA